MTERAPGAIYERYVGRWSRVVADDFLPWLGVRDDAVWLDVPCGAGALTQAILAACRPAHVDGCDRSEAYVAYARSSVADPRATFSVGDVHALPYRRGTYDAVVSGLPFPSIPGPLHALSELARLARPGGVVGAYVWDFDGEMQMLRRFWDAATALDADADEPADDERFTICAPGALAAALRAIGLDDVTAQSFDAPTRFRDFDDYWTPFTTGASPAQVHVQSLGDDRRRELRERLRATLPIAPDGSISLIARAWAAQGRKPNAA